MKTDTDILAGLREFIPQQDEEDAAQLAHDYVIRTELLRQQPEREVRAINNHTTP